MSVLWKQPVVLVGDQEVIWEPIGVTCCMGAQVAHSARLKPRTKQHGPETPNSKPQNQRLGPTVGFLALGWVRPSFHAEGLSPKPQAQPPETLNQIAVLPNLKHQATNLKA